ncbi:MAG: acyltransferase [Lachnospiraceae bacterium]|nr:acyltransferase [Lachnospiraceae bacterium]
MNLSECAETRENNLNVIRFIAAVLVIYCHSFPLTANGSDYLGRITGGQIDCGGLAVSLFFFYGGFLICKSMFRLQTAKCFFKARLTRIIPPLALVTCVLTFIVGPLFTTYSATKYFSDGNTYKYLLNSVFVLVHELPGVFSSNSYGATVNGSLWTLPVEFLCYIMCYVLYRFQMLRKKRLKWIAILAVLLYAIAHNILGGVLIGAALKPAMLFFVGICCYVYREYIPINHTYALVAGIGCIAGAWLGIFNVIIFVCFTYVLLWTAFGMKHKWSTFGTKFELSYGIYLVGFPIQQILCDLTGNQISQQWNFFVAVVISVFLGFPIAMFEKVSKKIMENV